MTFDILTHPRHGGGLGGLGFGYCMEDQVPLPTLVVALGGISLMWWFLYSKIKANGGRRKREDEYFYGINFLQFPPLIDALLIGK